MVTIGKLAEKQKMIQVGLRNTRQNSELRITRLKAKARISYKDMANVSRELVCLVVKQSVDPVSFNQAWMHENVSERKCWCIAIEDELKMMMDKEVWSIVKKPENVRMMGMKWVFKKKMTEDIELDWWRWGLSRSKVWIFMALMLQCCMRSVSDC